MGTKDGMQSQNHANYSDDSCFKVLSMLIFLQFRLYFHLHHKSLAAFSPFSFVHFNFLNFLNAHYFSGGDDAQILNS